METKENDGNKERDNLKGDEKKDLVYNLLKEHEFAYMPNQVLLYLT